MVEACTDPVQLKPFELLDDIMNTVRLTFYFSLIHLVMLFGTQIVDATIRGCFDISKVSALFMSKCLHYR